MTDAVISALAKTVGGSQDDIKQGLLQEIINY